MIKRILGAAPDPEEGAGAFLYNRKLRQRETFQGEFAEANSLETCTPVHVFLYNRKLRQCETFQGEFAEANSLETCTPVHVFYTIGNCDDVSL